MFLTSLRSNGVLWRVHYLSSMKDETWLALIEDSLDTANVRSPLEAGGVTHVGDVGAGSAVVVE